ncbi:MAG: beta-mannosidase, partial [Ruminococcus sp.]|nr:beta-mannosidase [Ruminococcus sp.]
MRKKLLAFITGLAVLTQSAAFQVSAKEYSLYEAENAVMAGNIKSYDDADASGGKAAGIFDSDADYITFEIEVPAEGSYDLVITSKGIGGSKSNDILVDGSHAGSFENQGDVYSDATLRGVLLTAGVHEITITKSWGWTYVDCLKVLSSEAIPDSVYDVEDTLINPVASPETKALFSYLCETYGKQILSGQFTDNGFNSDEFRAIYDATGKYPAVLGLDLMNYCPSRQEKGADCYAVERAVEFHEKGGIVTMSWHWNSPDEYLKEGNEDNGSPRWWGGFYTSNTDIDIAAIMSGSDPDGKALLDADIAAIAKQLGRLQDKGVPVLWRPLHEASGGWFWWGAKGPEAYKQFWYYLYDQLTNTYHLNNLIWVWNGGAADWYPGNEYVDIIGDDIYIDSYNPSTA